MIEPRRRGADVAVVHGFLPSLSIYTSIEVTATNPGSTPAKLDLDEVSTPDQLITVRAKISNVRCRRLYAKYVGRLAYLLD